MTGGEGEKKPINAAYRLHCVILETGMCARFLGVDISSNISWGSHIDRITGTAGLFFSMGVHTAEAYSSWERTRNLYSRQQSASCSTQSLRSQV